jgi:hypothetical protein
MAINNKITRGLFYDLEKAFDCVYHEILSSKLEFNGVTGKAKLWLVIFQLQTPEGSNLKK